VCVWPKGKHDLPLACDLMCDPNTDDVYLTMITLFPRNKSWSELNTQEIEM